MSVDILDRDAVRAGLLRHGLQLKDVAELGGIAPDTLTRILNGRAPDVASLVGIHHALRVAEARSRGES